MPLESARGHSDDGKIGGWSLEHQCQKGSESEALFTPAPASLPNVTSFYNFRPGTRAVNYLSLMCNMAYYINIVGHGCNKE